MAEYTASTYGDRIAARYDELHSDRADTDAAVETLTRLAGHGRVLELGIGTGRIALPLAARGLEVHGVDASEAMVARLRAKPGGRDIPVSIHDFVDFSLGAQFELVFVVFNTFFALLSQEDQLRCFTAVARHLVAGGVFLIEAFVPDLARFVRGQHVSADVKADTVQMNVSRHDAVEQRVKSYHLHFRESGVEMFPVQIRYAWPTELDLMARLAGLRLKYRWADWAGNRFTSQSTGHVSVYEKLPAKDDGGNGQAGNG